MTILTTDEAEICFELHGDGPPLVFVHGASGTHLSWWQQVAELRHRFSCLIYDLRGFGRSRSRGTYDPGDGEAHLRDLEALVDHVGFGGQKLALMGASLGTAPAMRYARAHVDDVAALVLCCGPGIASTALVDAGWQARHQRMRERYAQVRNEESPLPEGVPRVRSAGEKERFAAAYHPYGPVGEAMHLDFPALTFLYAEIMASAGGPPTPATFPVFTTRPLLTEQAAAMRFPVLVVGGTEDPLFSVAELTEVASLFPHARTEFFKGAGHLAYFERPRRFNDLVERFLQEVC